ncbi:MAG: hypothetical protein GY791_01280 [Alphaproteobacteria bacterium]|nr:hypothetical protein [Alphaproteobacteria bacterium]
MASGDVSAEAGRIALAVEDACAYLGPSLFAPCAAIHLKVALASGLFAVDEATRRSVLGRLRKSLVGDRFIALSRGQGNRPRRFLPTLIVELASGFQAQTTGCPPARSWIADEPNTNIVHVCFEYEDWSIGAAAGMLAVAHLNDAVARERPDLFDRDEDYDFSEMHAAFRNLVELDRPPEKTTSLVREARARRLPIAVTEDFIVEIGHGSRARKSTEMRPGESAGSFLDRIFHDPADARIPIAAITGTNGKSTTSRMVTHIATLSGVTTGCTTTDGGFVGNEKVLGYGCTGPYGAAKLLGDERVELAVLETTRGGLLVTGLGFDHCAVAAILNVEEDHIGENGIDTLDDMARLKQLVVDAAEHTAILNADDVRCAAMASTCPARHVSFVTMQPDHPGVANHIENGGLAVRLGTVDGKEALMLMEHGEAQLVLPVDEMPSVMGGLVRHNLQNAMFASAIAHALGLSALAIAQGLRSFDCSFGMSPGRMNFFEGLPFRVLMDWAHNEHGFRALHRTISRIPVSGRRIGVVTVGGGRTDGQIVDIGALMAGWFDHYILYHWDDRYGRAPHEIPKLMRDGLIMSGVDAANAVAIPDPVSALDTALRMCRPGDFLTIVPYDNDATWARLKSYRRAVSGRSTVGRSRPRAGGDL